MAQLKDTTIDGTLKIPNISSNNVLKINTNNEISAASAGTDYVSPIGSYISPTIISENDDLNNYRTLGYYATASSVTSVSNGPFNGLGFLLEVIKCGDYFIQRATQYNGYRIAIRYGTSSTWYSWYYQQPRVDVTGIVKGQGDGIFSAATAGTDYVAPSYFSQATPVGLTMINGAASQGWYCQVYKCGNIGMVILAITVSSTQGIANNTTIANLPTGYSAWQPAMVCPSGNASNTGAIGVINRIVRVSGILAKGSYTCCIPYIIAE